MEDPMNKKIAVLLISALCLTSMAFAGGGSQTAPASGTQAKKAKLFGFTLMDLTVAPARTAYDTVKAAVEANGDQLMAMDGKLDQTVQNNAVEDMLTRGIDVLLIQPVDSQSVEPALLACQRAGVPVIVVDSAVARPELTASFIATDNLEAGRNCAKEMLRTYPNGAKIAIQENPLADSVLSRVQGLEEGLAGTNVKIVTRKNLTRYEQVLGTAEDMIQAFPDLDAFWGLNDDVGLIMLGAVQSAGLQNQIKIFTVGGTPPAKKSIAVGGLWSTVVQLDRNMAQTSVDVAYKVLAGEKVDPVYRIGTFIINRDNIKSYDVDKWE
jgi:ribose transport system substrate-binding protein